MDTKLRHLDGKLELMRFELTRISATEPKSVVSANSTIVPWFSAQTIHNCTAIRDDFPIRFRLSLVPFGDRI